MIRAESPMGAKSEEKQKDDDAKRRRKIAP
jgi:hypothetical protein